MHPSVEKFQKAANQLSLTLNIIEHQEATRTAVEAANAVNCDVAQIVKSLCFMVNDEPVMALVSGQNQLDEKRLAQLCEVGRKKVRRATAEQVKTATGYSIGGVTPFGHATQMKIFVDNDLMAFPTIWAAAGTPNAVFEIEPALLLKTCGGTAVDLKKER
ncbi:MAG: YbaK/EbsC family protein [Chloroflexota bacterium]